MFDLPLRVADLMKDFEPVWFFAGGWAIDLYLGRVTRPHDDVEIAVFRRDQLALQKYLSGWNLKKASDGKLVPWRQDEFLELPVHEIHCFRKTKEPQRLEVLLNETGGDDWIFRRDPRITRALSQIIRATDSGTKVLAPEIVLLYKSKNPRAKDERDFRAVIDHLAPESKDFLREALKACYGKHIWLERLR